MQEEVIDRLSLWKTQITSISQREPLLWIRSKVKTFFHVASQAKKLTLGGTKEFQITLAEKSPSLSDSKALYRDLTKNLLSFAFVQTTFFFIRNEEDYINIRTNTGEKKETIEREKNQGKDERSFLHKLNKG